MAHVAARTDTADVGPTNERTPQRTERGASGRKEALPGGVNRIAEAQLRALTWRDLLPIIIGLWVTTGLQRSIGAYMGYGRNLFVRRVQLEAERRLLQRASTVDLGHFDNSDWHDRLARAARRSGTEKVAAWTVPTGHACRAGRAGEVGVAYRREVA